MDELDKIVTDMDKIIKGTKSKKEYILDKNGEKVKLKNGNFKTRKIDTVDYSQVNRHDFEKLLGVSEL